MPLLNGTVRAVYNGGTRVVRVYHGKHMVWPTMPPVALIPGGEVQAAQQQQVVFTATAGVHTGEVLYFWDETLNTALPSDHVDVGGLPVVGSAGNWFIRYPSPGPHTFKFWATGATTRIALRLGTTTPNHATDTTLARVVVS